MAKQAFNAGEIDESQYQVGNADWKNMPEMIVKAKITEHSVSEKGNHKLVAEITEGDYQGASLWTTLGTDLSKAGNQSGWLHALLSIGTAKDKAVKMCSDGIDPDVLAPKLVGKTATFYVKPAPANAALDDQGRRPLPDTRMVSPLFAKSKAAELAAKGGNTQPAASDAAPAGAKARNGAAGKEKPPAPPASEGSASDELDL